MEFRNGISPQLQLESKTNSIRDTVSESEKTNRQRVRLALALHNARIHRPPVYVSLKNRYEETLRNRFIRVQLLKQECLKESKWKVKNKKEKKNNHECEKFDRKEVLTRLKSFDTSSKDKIAVLRVHSTAYKTQKTTRSPNKRESSVLKNSARIPSNGEDGEYMQLSSVQGRLSREIYEKIINHTGSNSSCCGTTHSGKTRKREYKCSLNSRFQTSSISDVSHSNKTDDSLPRKNDRLKHQGGRQTGRVCETGRGNQLPVLVFKPGKRSDQGNPKCTNAPASWRMACANKLPHLSSDYVLKSNSQRQTHCDCKQQTAVTKSDEYYKTLSEKICLKYNKHWRRQIHKLSQSPKENVSNSKYHGLENAMPCDFVTGQNSSTPAQSSLHTPSLTIYMPHHSNSTVRKSDNENPFSSDQSNDNKKNMKLKLSTHTSKQRSNDNGVSAKGKRYVPSKNELTTGNNKRIQNKNTILQKDISQRSKKITELIYYNGAAKHASVLQLGTVSNCSPILRGYTPSPCSDGSQSAL